MTPHSKSLALLPLLLLGVSLASPAEAEILRSSVKGSTLIYVLRDQEVRLTADGIWTQDNEYAEVYFNTGPTGEVVTTSIEDMPRSWSTAAAKLTIIATLGHLLTESKKAGGRLEEKPTFSTRAGPAGLKIHRARAVIWEPEGSQLVVITLIPTNRSEMVSLIGIGSDDVAGRVRGLASSLELKARRAGEGPSGSGGAPRRSARDPESPSDSRRVSETTRSLASENLSDEEKAELIGEAIGSLTCCVGTPILAIVGLVFLFKSGSSSTRRRTSRSRGRSKVGKPPGKSKSRARRVTVEVVEDDELDEEDSRADEDDELDEEDSRADDDVGDDEGDDDEGDDDEGDDDEGDDDDSDDGGSGGEPGSPSAPGSGPPKRKYRTKLVKPPEESSEPKTRKTKLKPVRPTRRRTRRR